MKIKNDEAHFLTIYPKKKVKIYILVIYRLKYLKNIIIENQWFMFIGEKNMKNNLAGKKILPNIAASNKWRWLYKYKSKWW